MSSNLLINYNLPNRLSITSEGEAANIIACSIAFCIAIIAIAYIAKALR